MTPERLHQLGLQKMQIGRYYTKSDKNPFEFDIYGNKINWLAEDVKVSDD